jgi:hypothetical protein
VRPCYAQLTSLNRLRRGTRGPEPCASLVQCLSTSSLPLRTEFKFLAAGGHPAGPGPGPASAMAPRRARTGQWALEAGFPTKFFPAGRPVELRLALAPPDFYRPAPGDGRLGRFAPAGAHAAGPRAGIHPAAAGWTSSCQLWCPPSAKFQLPAYARPSVLRLLSVVHLHPSMNLEVLIIIITFAASHSHLHPTELCKVQTVLQFNDSG